MRLATLADNLKNIDKAIQNMKTDRAKYNRLAKEKVDAKADLQRQINVLDAQISDLQLNRPKNWENSLKRSGRCWRRNSTNLTQFAVNDQSEKFAPHGSTKAVLQAIDKMLVKLVEEEKSDVIERNIIELDEKFYIKFAQFEQRQKEMDWNTMETINVEQCRKIDGTFLELYSQNPKAWTVYADLDESVNSSTTLKYFWNRTVQIQDELLQSEDQNS